MSHLSFRRLISMGVFRSISIGMLLLLSCFNNAQNAVIKAKVLDDKTGLPIEFVNVYLKKALLGTMADEKGEFNLETKLFPDTLVVSFIGYTALKLYLPEAPKSRLTLRLIENTALLAEVEVVTYQDPGKHIMKQVIAFKGNNDLKRFNNNVFDEYRKTEVDVLNVSAKDKLNFFKNVAGIYSVFSKDSLAGTAPLYFTEKYFRTYHSNNLQTHIEHEVAKKELGLTTDKLGVKLEKFELKINIYDAIIPILKTSFISPVSALGIIYYKFIPLDTVSEGGRRIITLQMKPKVRNENTFEGTIRVEDETFAITEFDLKTSAGSNINFINSLAVREDFELMSKGPGVEMEFWVPKSYKSAIEFNNGLELLGIPIPSDTAAKKVRLSTTSKFGNYIVNSQNLNANNFYTNSRTTDTASIETKSAVFDDSYRLEQLSEKEKAIYKAIDSLKTDKKFIRETKLTSLVATGYWDAGCKLRFGPLSSLLSTNLIEGLRVRSGFWTLPCVSKTFNFNAYGAYGLKDKVVKGGVGIKYTPLTKRYAKTEIIARSDYDALLEFDDELDKDNVFTLALRKNIPAYQVFIQQVKLLQELDLDQNWSLKGFVAVKTLNPTFNYQYYKLIDDQIVDFTPLKKININEAGFSLRYAHNERTTIFNYDKIRISSPYPVISLNYTYGFEGTKNTYFDYHKITLNITQELVLPIKGSLFYSASAGKMFGVVPAILLFAPTGNAYYVANKYTFNNMLPYEFAADAYASLMLRYNMGGLILNKIPLINKFKLRERFIFNNYIGTINAQNKQFNNINSLKETGSVPYREAGVGIGNIFNVLSIDAIWRVSQFNHSQALTRFGIYTTFMIIF